MQQAQQGCRPTGLYFQIVQSLVSSASNTFIFLQIRLIDKGISFTPPHLNDVLPKYLLRYYLMQKGRVVSLIHYPSYSWKTIHPKDPLVFLPPSAPFYHTKARKTRAFPMPSNNHQQLEERNCDRTLNKRRNYPEFFLYSLLSDRTQISCQGRLQLVSVD